MAKFVRRNSRSAKISASKVLEMRQRYSEGVTQSKLALESGLSVVQVGRIVRGESWMHLPITPDSGMVLQQEAATLFEQLKKDGFAKDPFDLELPDDATGDGLAKLEQEAAKALPGDKLLRDLKGR